MQPQRATEEAREWLRVAVADLRLAEVALNALPPLIAGALYHCQQAAEKSLKAFLIFRGTRYPLTHDLGELLAVCSTLDSSLEAEILPAVKLTEFAILFRYPGEVTEPPLAEAREWLALARSVYESIDHRVSVAQAQE